MLNLSTDETEAVANCDNSNKNKSETSTGSLRCRLCHAATHLDTDSPNIFESNVDFAQEDYLNEKFLIVDVCESIWSIKYERHEFLPERICTHCLEMLQDFYVQRHGMQQREKELQQDLKSVIALDAKYRPGLNGNPGVFEFGADEEGCVIVDVDPDQLCETSDDEFLGSDGEGELEDAEWDDEDEEEQQNDEDVEMPLGMDAAQMALMQAHQTSADPNSSNANAHPKSAFLCQYCDLAFTLQPDCQQHELALHDPSAPYSCNFCQLRLTTRPALIAHIKEFHDAERPYVCAHCNKGFVRRSDLKKHTIVHTGVRPFSCNVCSKSFSRNTNLTKHLRIHSSVKPFVCQKCPRSFQTALELMKHTRSHSEVKPYQCGRCPASFARKDKLLMHQQVHNKRDVELQQQLNVRAGLNAPTADQMQLPLHPYVDTDAPASVAPQQLASYPYQPQPQLPSGQTKLKQSSKPARNFRCNVCDKSFQRDRDLQRHLALHMDTLFACKLCGQGFNRSEQLQRHELEAHGPSFTCAICCITFLQQSELETHLKVHELQHSVAKSTKEALNASGAVMPVGQMPATHVVGDQAKIVANHPPTVTQEPAQLRPTAAEMSFYSNMIPTMNLGFYSETRPEERNGI